TRRKTPPPHIWRKYAQKYVFDFGMTLVIQAAAAYAQMLRSSRGEDWNPSVNRVKQIRTKAGWRWLTALSLSLSLLTGIVVSEGAKAQTNDRQRRSPNNSLSKYATDLTALAEEGRFSSLEERTKDTVRAIEILTRHHKNN